MGVPKFFRFISERWPLISKLIDEDQIPEFDNLYLDMNSILHNCTHSNGKNYDDLVEGVSDDVMYTAIFAYIDHLFNTIKPKKVFYMAIDGVAPRAKMNQQRSRRFRSALEAEKERKKQQETADLEGIDAQGNNNSDLFDSNAITPGTEFMAKVSEHIKFFIHKKVTTDVNWQNIDIIFSGHEVPGEGEHKIMKYIRTMKSQPDYDSNVRHCIYGLDADLIMLGLVTHDPHFSLLREEVKFGPQRGSSKGSTLEGLESQKFYLLHLSLVREYLELEFHDLRNFLDFNYSFERILDDFILIMYVIGNDFLPNLPDLHINKGAFPLLLKTFKKFLVNSDGYINDDGKINFQRLKIWLSYLSLFEFENFENGNVDIDFFNSRLDKLSLDNENKKKLRELKIKRHEEQSKQSAKLGSKKIEQLLSSQKKSSITNEFSILNDDVEDEEIDQYGNNNRKLDEFHQLDESMDTAFSKIFSFIEPWLINIYSTDAARIDLDNITDDAIPSLEISNFLVPDNGSLQFEFLKQIAHDFDLIVVQDQDLGMIHLKLDIGGIEPNETDEEYEERINGYHHFVETYASKFSKITPEELTQLSIDFKKVTIDDENIDNYLEDKKFISWKNSYYSAKFGFTLDDKEQFNALTKNYLDGLQWVLYYYYKGCPSWSWYYKYYFAPRISDITSGITEDLKVEFPKDKPFKPFQQLMGVLPARSNGLLPPIYRPLMLNETSPIIDFYPSEVEIDKNGKTAEWEYVFKLAFVDEKRLIEAMAPYDAKLTPEEKLRNSFGTDLVYKFNPQISKFLKSSMPRSFPDLVEDHCVEISFELPHIEGEEIREFGDEDYYSENMNGKPFNHLCKGAKTGTALLAGFPTLKTLEFDFKLAIEYLTIFNNPSRSESMILTLKNNHRELEDLSVEQICSKYLKKIVYVAWPYLKEAKVVSISDGTFKYELDENGRVSHTPLRFDDVNSYKIKIRKFIDEYHLTRGINLGNINLLFSTVSTNGLIRNKKGAYVKTFRKKVEEYPFQVVVNDVINPDPRFQEREAKPIDQEFPVGSKVTFLGDFAYGNEAIVTGYKNSINLNLQISKISKKEEPTIGTRKAYEEKNSLRYYNQNEAGRILGVHPIFLSRVTSSFLIMNTKDKKINIGLDLKFEGKKLKVLGYTKRAENGWYYSSYAIDLVAEYRNLFPEFFKNLMIISKSRGKGFPSIREFYPRINDSKKLDEKLEKIFSYLTEKKSKFNTTNLQSDSLNRMNITAIENFSIQYISTQHSEITRTLNNVPIEAILDNQNAEQLLKKQHFHLGDRVCNVLDGTSVPIFSKGTVVGIHVIDEKLSLNVVFDYPLINGNNLNGRLRSSRGLTVSGSHLLNLTDKQFIYHTKSSLEKAKSRQMNKRLVKQPVPVVTKKPEEKKLSLEEEEKIKKEKEEREKSKHELLSILKKPTVTEEEGKGEEKEPVTIPTNGTRSIDNDTAAKEVYGAIMANMFTSSSTPATIPQPAAPSGNFNGFAPLPPVAQFFPPPAPVADSQASSEIKSLLTGGSSEESQQRPQSSNRGRGGFKGRGRGTYRGNDRGRGRGRGRGGFRGSHQTNDN